MSVFKQIASSENVLYKSLHKLAGSHRFRKQSNHVLLDGIHLLVAAREAGLKPDLLVITARSRNHPEVAAQLAHYQGDIVELSDHLFLTLSSTHPEVGLISRIERPVIRSITESFVLLLEDIQDPGNLGNILRTAAAAGVDTVYLSSGCADAYSSRALRAGQGAHFFLSIQEQQNLLKVGNAFNGKLYATSPINGISLFDTNFIAPVAFVFGNEGSGIRPSLMALAAKQIKIPMAGKMESLNVAASVAICLFECVRQLKN
ncbi:MAG TPA: RNA methyltransferase [Burkholderiales bacterium]|nr:RNA methyltransferase [Burkholderiales bacterium]